MTSVHDFDPFSIETIDCPYAFYAAMREEAPIFEASPGVFFVSTYELVNQVLRDTDNFSSGKGAAFLNFQGEEGLAPPSQPPAEIQEILAGGPPDRDTLLSADPPAHTRFRSLVNRSLSLRRMAEREPLIRQVVTDLIDAFIDDGKVELVEQFSMMVPLTVVSHALGVPPEDLEKYKDWSIRTVKNLSGRISYEDALDSATAARDLRNYIADKVEEARDEPQDNVIGDLVNAHMLADEDGDTTTYRPLDTPEIVSIVQQLLVAGQETVNYLISSLTLLLIENPEQMDAVRGDPSLIAAMVEEGVRAESPIQALGRFAARDVEIAGVTIPEGSRVIILYGCGNRDDGHFKDAAKFDIKREDLRDHVGFGAGPHYCVGAALARLESRVAFEELLSRLTNIRLAPEKADLSHKYNFIFRALNALHLEFDKA